MPPQDKAVAYYVEHIAETNGVEGKKNSKKDPNAPKKGLSSFFVFSGEQRAATKEENPEKSTGEIASMLGEMWKGMTEAQKAPYQEEATKEGERYKREMEEYRIKQHEEKEAAAAARSQEDAALLGEAMKYHEVARKEKHDMEVGKMHRKQVGLPLIAKYAPPHIRATCTGLTSLLRRLPSTPPLLPHRPLHFPQISPPHLSSSLPTSLLNSITSPHHLHAIECAQEEKVMKEEKKEAKVAKAEEKKEAQEAKAAAKEAKREKKEANKDKPKRAASAYLLFGNKHREEVKAAQPELSAKEVMSTLAVMWKQVGDEEKAELEKEAARDKERYEAEMRSWEFHANLSATIGKQMEEERAA